jgi:hypothetical protein
MDWIWIDLHYVDLTHADYGLIHVDWIVDNEYSHTT